MMKLLVTLAIPFLALASAQAQHKQKMDLTLQHFLTQDHVAGEEVSLFIHGDAERVGSAVRAHGGRVTMSLPQVVNARVPVSAVNALAQEEAVGYFEFNAAKGTLLNDSMRVKARVNEVHQGLAPLPQGYDGTGVVFGIIDTGLDVYHPDFRDENDVTRVVRYWDQRFTANPGSPAPYGYGIEWTREELEAGGPNFPSDTILGHGTPVAGTAVSNGRANGRHKGVAPEAEIIVVASNMGTSNWAATVADGVKYILDEADALGKPAVINISMGTYSGSHDGKDAAALFIDDLLHQQPGRALAAAAGNSHGTYPYHLRTDVDQDTSFTWFTTNQNGSTYNIFNFPNVFFEVWADAEDFENVSFAMGADRPVPSLNYRGRGSFHTVADAMGEVIEDPIVSASGNTLGTVQYYAQERGDQILLQVLIASPDTADCLWRFMSTGSGAFDVWTLTTYTRTSNVIGPVLAQPLGLPFPTAAAYPAMANYVQPDYLQHIVDSWACIPDVLTVANYCNEVSYVDYFGVARSVPGLEQDIAPKSSTGPTRDLRMKPDIAATGDLTFSAGPLASIQWIIDNQVGWKVDPGGKHIRDGGTSQAAPVVAGAAALYLQKCPDATITEVAEAVRRSARRDAFTGTVPNHRWGMGKLDVFNALLNKSALSADVTSFCEGDSVRVDAPQGFQNVQWSNGAVGSSIAVEEGGELSAVMTSASGCLAYSDTISLEMLEPPSTPIIDANGPVLTSTVGTAYQWYAGGDPIPDATDQEWTAYWPGSYQVVVFGENGCSALSDAVEVITVGFQDEHASNLMIWPSPAREELRVQLPDQATRIDLRIVAGDGKVVRALGSNTTGMITISLAGVAPGVYTLQGGSAGEVWSRRFVKVP